LQARALLIKQQKQATGSKTTSLAAYTYTHQDQQYSSFQVTLNIYKAAEWFRS